MCKLAGTEEDIDDWFSNYERLENADVWTNNILDAIKKAILDEFSCER